jgi:hypothetical protein
MSRANLMVLGCAWVLSVGCGSGGSGGGVAGAGGAGPADASVGSSDTIAAGGATGGGGVAGAQATGGVRGSGGVASGGASGSSPDGGGSAGASGTGGVVDGGNNRGTGGFTDGRDAAGNGGAGGAFDASGTDGVSGTGGSTGGRDAADVRGTDGGVDVGSAVESPGGTCSTWKVSSDLFVNSFDWQGWAWSRSGGGSTISSVELAADGALCVSGTVAAAGEGVFASLGFDVDYPRAVAAARSRSPTGTGITYRIRNTGASALMLKVSGPDAATDINNEWCYPLTGASGTVSETLAFYQFHAKDCGAGSTVISGYSDQPIVSVSIVVPPASGAATPFSYCLESLTEVKPTRCIDESNTSVPIVGVTWTRRGTTSVWMGLASSADGSKLVAASNGVPGGVTGEYLYTSADRGVTWTQRGPKQPWTSVASSADGTKLVAGACDGWLHTSTDSGATWILQGEGAPRGCWTSVASSADGTKLVAAFDGEPGTDKGFIYTSADSGLTWAPHATQEYWAVVASSADGMRLVAGRLHGGVYASSDFGETWTLINTKDFTEVAMLPDGMTILGGGNDAPDYLYLSADFGATWTQLGPQLTWSGVAMSSDGTRLLAADGQNTEGALYLSKDSGLTWTSPDPVYVPRLWSAVASSADGRSLVAVISKDCIYTSSGALLP